MARVGCALHDSDAGHVLSQWLKKLKELRWSHVELNVGVVPPAARLHCMRTIVEDCGGGRCDLQQHMVRE